MEFNFGCKIILLLGIFVFINQSDGSFVENVLPSGSRYLSYSARNGPPSWGFEFPLCDGARQSPVSLDSCEHKTLPPLSFSGHWDSRPEGFSIRNTGETVLLTYSGEAPTLSGGPLQGEYTLAQAHFHWGDEGEEGSEHQMHGHLGKGMENNVPVYSYGMEMHLVHYKTEYGSVSDALDYPDGLAVVGLMFKEYECNNRELDPLMRGLGSVLESGASFAIPGHAMTWLQHYLTLEHSCGYFTYQGSLTTPPCTQVVTWINLKRLASVGHLQLEQFRSLLSDEGHGHHILENRRPVQALNSRHVFCST